MRIEIDTDQKVITLFGNVNVKELFDYLTISLHPDEWKNYSIHFNILNQKVEPIKVELMEEMKRWPWVPDKPKKKPYMWQHTINDDGTSVDCFGNLTYHTGYTPQELPQKIEEIKGNVVLGKNIDIT